MRNVVIIMLLLVLAVEPASANVAVELRGSPASMLRQNRVAVDAGLAFAETVNDIDRLVERGVLVRLEGNENYEVLDNLVSNAALPATRLLVERLAEQYHEATGEKLVVTSLTRPTSMQPSNSHTLSIHPTGAALDLRVSRRAQSRQWLESVLLSLERKGVLDVTREYRPPHYHVAVFPDAYLDYVGGIIGEDELALALSNAEEVVVEAPAAAPVQLMAAAAVVDPDPKNNDEEPATVFGSIWNWIRSLIRLG